MILKTLIDKMRDRHFRGMRTQTEQLDPQTRNNLREFLEDVPAEMDDLKQLDAELDQAHEKLKHLLEKEAFVGKRLASYRVQLQKYHDKREKKEGAAGDAAISPEQEQKEEEDYEKHLQMLQQIELSHQAMVRTIDVLQERIELMEHRQFDLHQMTAECNVVYQTADALQHLEPISLAQNTSELFDSVQVPPEAAPSSPEETTEQDASVPPTTTDDDDDDEPKSEADEEQGEVELTEQMSEPSEPETKPE